MPNLLRFSLLDLFVMLTVFAALVYANLAVRNDGPSKLVSTYGWPFTIEEYVTIDFDQPLISYRDISDIPDPPAKIDRMTIEFKYSSLILNVLVAVGVACLAIFIARCFVRALSPAPSG